MNHRCTSDKSNSCYMHFMHFFVSKLVTIFSATKYLKTFNCIFVHSFKQIFIGEIQPEYNIRKFWYQNHTEFHYSVRSLSKHLQVFFKNLNDFIEVSFVRLSCFNLHTKLLLRSPCGFFCLGSHLNPSKLEWQLHARCVNQNTLVVIVTII